MTTHSLRPKLFALSSLKTKDKRKKIKDDKTAYPMLSALSPLPYQDKKEPAIE